MANSGAEAVALLVTSNRIQGDLETYATSSEDQFNVVVREFKHFDVMYEFRGYVVLSV